MALPAGPTWLTPTLAVHVLEGAAPGPTAVIQAGIHGNEIAGVHALQELLEEDFQPARGRLLVIPVMNPPAYRARERTRPGGLDLNRCFPGDPEAAEPERRLAHSLFELMVDERPQLVATLHESLKRHHPEIADSYGQSIVYGADPMPEIIGKVIDQLNDELDHPYEHWAPHYFPVATSSTEQIVAATGCLGLCVETWMGFEERRRIDLQRRVVELLLQQLGLWDAPST